MQNLARVTFSVQQVHYDSITHLGPFSYVHLISENNLEFIEDIRTAKSDSVESISLIFQSFFSNIKKQWSASTCVGLGVRKGQPLPV